jgi:cytochrome c
MDIIQESIIAAGPKDIPLPLPLPEWVLVFLLVVSFLLHILFVNLMIGGSVLTLWAEIKGKKNPEYDTLAKEIANTITVNKSLAVVIGVAPLLTINALYTLFFYSANALTGTLWISIVPLVTIVFLLLYFHKYSWERYSGTPARKRFHIGINAAAVILLLFVPLIFLANINLMLFPEKWGTVKGFFSAMLMSNVIPRYLHFLCATLAVTGLFLFWYMKRKSYPFESIFGQTSRAAVLKRWYRLALWASLLQLALGPLNLFTLPWHAVTWTLGYLVIGGTIFALFAMFLLWRELKGPEEKLGRRFYLIAAILTITVLFMGTVRHVYRASALAPHQEKIQKHTKQHMEKVKKLEQTQKTQ